MIPLSSTDRQATSSPERPTKPMTETAHTDPGPTFDEPLEQRDWSNWSDLEDRNEMIAEAAYYKAEQRGFELGHDDMDWLEAEQELLERMAQEQAQAMC